MVRLRILILKISSKLCKGHIHASTTAQLLLKSTVARCFLVRNIPKFEIMLTFFRYVLDAYLLDTKRCCKNKPKRTIIPSPPISGENYKGTQTIKIKKIGHEVFSLCSLPLLNDLKKHLMTHNKTLFFIIQ